MGMESAVDVRQAGPGEVDRIAEVLTEAFLDGPVAEWLCPDRPTRQAMYARSFRVIAVHALIHGDVRIHDDGAGVALWYPGPAPADPDLYDALAQIAGQHVDRYLCKLETTVPYHPTVAHHHLAYLAVHPDRQRSGVGTALLKAYHAELDTA